jgi:hypothetical protein
LFNSSVVMVAATGRCFSCWWGVTSQKGYQRSADVWWIENTLAHISLSSLKLHISDIVLTA